MPPKKKTLDDIDSDDDYVPSAAVLQQQQQQQQRGATLAPGVQATSAASAAVDDFFGTFTASPPSASSSNNYNINKPNAYASPPQQQQQPQAKKNDFFDDFFGPSSAASPNSTNNATGNSNSNNKKAAAAGASDDFLLDVGAKATNVQRHVTSDPMAYFDMATGGGNRLRPKATLGDPTLGGGASLLAATAARNKIGSGADNGSAHILGNPILLARMTHYEVLGVTELYAEAEDINKAYKKRCLTLHPDRVVGREQTEAEKTYFKAVVKAYEVLNDEANRHVYDELLKEHRAAGGVGAPPGQDPSNEFHNNASSPNYGGSDQNNTNQNNGGWDFLDDDRESKLGGLGDFAPKQPSPVPTPAPTAAATKNDDFFFGAPVSSDNCQQPQRAPAAPTPPQQHGGGGGDLWGNFSSSSMPSGTFRQQQRPKDGSLFGGQHKATIDDLFS